MGYSVALPVIVSSGKLTGVETTISGDKAVTSLNIGSLDADSATVATLSAAITAGNEGQNHDESEKQCKKFFHNNTPYISFVFLHMFLNTMAGIVFRNYNTILYGYLSIILTVL